MSKIQFTLNAEPIAQGRPRFSTYGGFAKAYDAPKSRDWKAYVADHARRAMFDADFENPLDGPLSVRIRFAFSMPKSYWRKRVPRPREHHIKRPDIDNLYKGVVDACEGIILHRDSEICKVVMDKVTLAQGEGPYVSVLFESLEPL